MLRSRSKSVDLIPVGGAKGSACVKKKFLGWTESICSNARKTGWTESICNNARKTPQKRSVFYTTDFKYQDQHTRSSVINLLSAGDISLVQPSVSINWPKPSVKTVACTEPTRKLTHTNSLTYSNPLSSTQSFSCSVGPHHTFMPSTSSFSYTSVPHPSPSASSVPPPQSLYSPQNPPSSDPLVLGTTTTRSPGTITASSLGTTTACSLGTTTACSLGTTTACSLGTTTACSLGTKMRVIRRNVHHKFLRLRSRSVDRLRLAGEEDRQVTMRPIRARRGPQGTQNGACGDWVDGAVIGEAVALVDYVPSPYDKTALPFKRGDAIEVLAMNPSGLWRGRCQGRVGNFKFINVRTVSDRMRRRKSGHIPLDWSTTRSVNNLLTAISLEQLTPVFVLNGFDTLEDVKNLDEDDLEYLGVDDLEEKEVILEAIAEVRARMAGEGVEDEATESSDDLSDKLGPTISCGSDSDKSSKTESGFHSTDDNEHCDYNNSGVNDHCEHTNNDLSKLSVKSQRRRVDGGGDSVPRSFLYKTKNLTILHQVGGNLLEDATDLKTNGIKRRDMLVDSQRL